MEIQQQKYCKSKLNDEYFAPFQYYFLNTWKQVFYIKFFQLFLIYFKISQVDLNLLLKNKKKRCYYFVNF